MIGSLAVAGDACKAPATCTEVQTCGSETCCGHCGRHCGCDKTCKIVCEMKEVKKTVWVVHCGEQCTMLPRCPLKCCCGNNGCNGCNACSPAATCENCEANGGKCNACASLENRKYNTPKCGSVREKKTLEKKEITCKVPTYKCVVVYSCSQCDMNTKEPAAPAAPAAPATPAPTPVKAASLPRTSGADEAISAPMPPVMGS
jgi:hypothetical protein